MNSELEAAQQLYGHSPAQIYSSTIDAHYGTASGFTPSQGWLSVSQIGNVPFVNTTNSQQCRMSELAPSIPTNTEIDDLNYNYIENQTEFIQTINKSLEASNITKGSFNPTLNEYIIEYLEKSPFKNYKPKTALSYLYRARVISSELGSQELNSIKIESINDFFRNDRWRKKNYGTMINKIFFQAFEDKKLSKLPFDTASAQKCKYKLGQQQSIGRFSGNNSEFLPSYTNDKSTKYRPYKPKTKIVDSRMVNNPGIWEYDTNKEFQISPSNSVSKQEDILLNDFIKEHLLNFNWNKYTLTTTMRHESLLNTISQRLGKLKLNEISIENINTNLSQQDRWKSFHLKKMLTDIFEHAISSGKLRHNPIIVTPKSPKKPTITALTTLFKKMDTVYSTEHEFFENAQPLETFNYLKNYTAF
jgi:hypothetical protein